MIGIMLGIWEKEIIKNSKYMKYLKWMPFISKYASNDEWYYIDKDRCYGENRHTYYKCDQWDGLLNCLKKEFNIGWNT